MESDVLERKMEEMRRKNEEILRRYKEIEEDKLNADELSNAAKLHRKNSDSEKPARPVTARQPRIKPATFPQMAYEDKRRHGFSESNGPPPDPNYNFLADPSRLCADDPDEGNCRNSDKSSGNTARQSQRHRNNYGGSDFSNVRTRMQQEKSSYKRNLEEKRNSTTDLTMQMTGRQRREYETWKKERERVDQARIDRQRASDGTWRREWDSNKADLDDAEGSRPHISNNNDLNIRKAFTGSERVISEDDGMLSITLCNDRKKSGTAEQFQKPMSSQHRSMGRGSERVISEDDGMLSITLCNDRKKTGTAEQLEKPMSSQHRSMGRGQSALKPRQRNHSEKGSKSSSSQWTFLKPEVPRTLRDTSLNAAEPPVSPHPELEGLSLDDKIQNQIVTIKGLLQDVHNLKLSTGQNSKAQTVTGEKSDSANEVYYSEDSENDMPTKNCSFGSKFENNSKTIYCGQQSLKTSEVYFSDGSGPEEEVVKSTKHVPKVNLKLNALEMTQKVKEEDDEWEDVSEEYVSSCEEN